MSNERQFDAEVLIGEYNKTVSAYVNENIQLKALLTQANKREEELLKEIEKRSTNEESVVQ